MSGSIIKKLTNFAQKRPVFLTSTVIERSLLFHTKFKLVEASYFKPGKIHFFDLPLEINIVTKKVASEKVKSEIFVSNQEIMFTQMKIQIPKTNPILFYFVRVFIKPTFLFTTVSENNEEANEEIEILVLDRNRL